jgi:H+/Cl- antiporter ClcA
MEFLGSMDANIWMIIGFLLAAYSVVANDSLQTLGTYISSNKKRTPKVVQMIFICTVTIFVLMLGWSINGGDPAWGRLAKFPTPETSPGFTSFLRLRCWASPPGVHP